jgi:hypothetical protein
MYRVYDDITYVEKKEDWDVMCCQRYICSCLIMMPMIIIARIYHILLTDCLFFHMLKINHDSPEFILEFGTVANSIVIGNYWADGEVQVVVQLPGSEGQDFLLSLEKGLRSGQ